MAIIPLSTIQKERLKRLEGALKKASKAGKLTDARNILADLKPILLNTGNQARYYISYLRYLEAVMTFGEIETAMHGFRTIRQRINSNTRVSLEASSLLAICHLRVGNFADAESIIQEVLKNDRVIKSEKKRAEFRKEAISRFDEEALIFGLSEKNPPILTTDMIEGVIVANIGRSDDELLENIGMQVPESAKHVLSRVDSFSKKQLPTAERLALPSGTEVVSNRKVGKKIQRFVSRILYNSFCDKESETYKNLVSGGITGTLITIEIAEIFQRLKIGLPLLVGLVATSIVRVGIDYICSVSQPKNLIDYR